MSKLPNKLVAHKSGCYRCHSADGVKDLCRVGRRLFLGWLGALDHDGKMFAMLGMPNEMRNEVKEMLDIPQEVVFGDKIQ